MNDKQSQPTGLGILRQPRLTLSSSSISWLQKTTLLALFSIFSLSVWLFLVANPSSLKPVARTTDDSSPHSPFRAAIHTLADTNRLWKSNDRVVRPQISLSLEQELAAVTSFIVSLPLQNIIPASVNPNEPIDPQLVLDFDTRSNGAQREMEQLMTDVWDTNPVVVFSKPCAAARELRVVLDSYNLHPSPIEIDLGSRSDADVLEPLLKRVSDSPLPLLLVHGAPIDVSSVDAIRRITQTGALRKVVSEAGAVIDGGKRKKGKRH